MEESHLDKLNRKYNNFYKYPNFIYSGSLEKIKIICPIHGDFEKRYSDHLSGRGCPKCIKKYKNILKGNKFIKKCMNIHDHKYDYSLVEYLGSNKKVKIICKIHGIFNQTPMSHLSGGGCPNCYYQRSSESQNWGLETFIQKSILRHGQKYDYSKTHYINSTTKVDIVCKTHGEFSQIPTSHIIFNEPCPKCRKYSSEYILSRFIKKHNNKYDYSMFNYDINKHNTKSYIDIICPKHGIFNQRINHHIRGTGCPVCKESIGEKLINEILIELNQEFDRQKTFDGCVSQNRLLFDFFIPIHNICIEFDGDQHIRPVKIFGGVDAFNKIKLRDKIKNDFCDKNKIILLRFNPRDKKENIKKEISKLLLKA